MGEAVANDAAAIEHFERVIRPLLVKRCHECHNAESGPDSANLRLDYRGGWLAGGDSGPAIDVDHPKASLLLQAISYDDADLQMPPRSKLPEHEIALLREWIAAGAIAPDERPSADGGEAIFDLEAQSRCPLGVAAGAASESAQCRTT